FILLEKKNILLQITLTDTDSSEYLQTFIKHNKTDDIYDTHVQFQHQDYTTYTLNWRSYTTIQKTRRLIRDIQNAENLALWHSQHRTQDWVYNKEINWKHT